MAWRQSLANWFTYARMILALPIALVLLVDEPVNRWAAAGLFIIASITDYFDGYFARRYKVVSTWGKMMDPIADKILVTASLIMLVALGRIDPLLVILLLSRDLIIGGIRAVAAADQIIIDAKSYGKLKTAVQMACIPTLMVNIELFGLPLPKIAHLGLWISVVLSTLSGIQYMTLFRKAKNIS